MGVVMDRMRTALFVPGDRPERFVKALSTEADVIIIDLEDAVLPDHKNAARECVHALSLQGKPVLLRINGFGTPWFQDDLTLLSASSFAGVMIPKSESVDALEIVRSTNPAMPLYPLVETVGGAMALEKLSVFPGVARLVFGTVDFALDSGIQDESGWLPIRTSIVLASRQAGIQAPIDGVVLDWKDPAYLQAQASTSRRLGFGGRLCIHPMQVGPINTGMLPTEQEQDWARRVLIAFSEAGHGAIVIDGKLVDEPLRKLAERWLGQVQ